MAFHKKGDHVHWAWGHGEGEGKVVEVHTADITRTLKGSEVTRHGSPENPAYVIEQDNGTQVLKLHSELR